MSYLVFDEADRMFDMGFGGFALSVLYQRCFKNVLCTAANFLIPLQNTRLDLLLAMFVQTDKVSGSP